MRRSVLIRRLGAFLALSAAGAAGAAALAPSSPYETGEQVYAGVRTLPAERLQIAGGEIAVRFADPAKPHHDEVIAWVRRSAAALTAYFGRFPVSHLDLLIVSTDGDGVRGGTTFGYRGAAIRVHVGRDASTKTFNTDWILVHEMVHAALPNVPRASLWVQEGQAVYVEPIARVQAGQLDPAEVWRWALVGMPKGEPEAGDLGLDLTHTWGRTYWGGAAFWMVADLHIRQRTHNRLGVQTALRAISRESGGNTAEWSVDQVMAAGDRATGGHELTELYAAMKDSPAPLDLPALFQALGVSMPAGQVVFDDAAPMADVRRAITTKMTGS
jgi:hypothetical protein